MANYNLEPELYSGSEEEESADSDEDIITDYLNGNNNEEMMEEVGGAVPDEAGGGAGAIPIISVTQHSPAASKAFFILEDNLRQLHGIQESIQRMRQVSVQTLRLQVDRRRLSGSGSRCQMMTNWSSLSCPSLCGGGSQSGGRNNNEDWLAGWDSPTPPAVAQYSWGDGGSRKGSLSGPKRRRSWASPWEVDEMSLSVGGRPRSVSLSSAETDENEEEGAVREPSTNRSASIPDHSDGIYGSRSLKVLSGGHHSTHSLHEMGFPLIPSLPLANKEGSTTSKDPERNVASNAATNTSGKWHLSPRILTLQKSISTPSILAVKDASLSKMMMSLAPNNNQTQPVQQNPSTGGPPSSFSRLSPYNTMESETDDDCELLVPDHHIHQHPDQLMHDASSSRYEPGFENDDDANSSKRRKRGSLFFRKRKDKEKDKSLKLKQPHHFVSVCHSNSQPCDVCAKSLTNKPALRCESCAITVHEHTCRDAVHECTRFKVPKSIPLGSKVSLASLNPIKQVSTMSSTVVPTGSTPSSVVTTPTASQTPGTPVISSPLFGANSKIGADKESSSDVGGILYEENHHGPNNESGDGTASDTIEGVVNASEIKDLDLDPELGILDEEAEAWVGTVDKKISKKLKEKEVKRQEHIYEFIITEKHHCLTLKVMQKIFAEGMRRELRFKDETVDRIFPCLEELLEYHLQFLRRLRHRQRQEAVVATIEDILRLQFSGPLGDQLRSLYGEFCSRHQEAVSLYKEMVKEDRKFAAFARSCTMNPLCKKKGIPECILFVTQRITKYPLLIDPLIKTSRETPEECLKLQQVLSFVKDILIGVNAQVAEKERKLRLIEIYNKIDAKSATTYRNKKFKKSDLLSSTRRLMFEGVAYLNHARGKVQLVTVVVLSDVVFFLQESNQKFHFVTQDNKAGVISLQKLLVREKAGGTDTRSIYLISSNPDDPEMYELQCQTPREKKIWIETIQAAVKQCPEDDDEDEGGIATSGQDLASQGEEERQRKIREAQEIKTRQLIATLKEKDRQLASMLEDKMSTFCELVELLANNEDGTNTWILLGSETGPPKYGHLVEHGFQTPQARETLSQALSELYRLLGVLFSSSSSSGWLSRSASSVGERQSDTFALPSLPKRAETFGGFDSSLSCTDGAIKKRSSEELSSVDPAAGPVVLQLNGEQQATGLELVHNVSSLISLLSSQATAFESLRADFLTEVKALKSINPAGSSSVPFAGVSGLGKFQHKASHNQRLEELRNLQDRLSKEKAEWARERASQEEQLSEQKKQLTKLQEQVRLENADVQQQRENLYQKLEALRGQGILLSPNMTIVSTAPTSLPPSAAGTEEIDLSASASSPPPSAGQQQLSLIPSPTPSASEIGRRKTLPGGSSPAIASVVKRESSGNLPLPMNLISAKNEQKAAAVLAAPNLPVKQQLPMKLAKLAGGGGPAGPGVPAHSSGQSSPGSGLVQQILPLRLSESLAEQKRTAMPSSPSKAASTTSKLSSNSFSPPRSTAEDFVAGHNRTGSSPASIQVLTRPPLHHPPRVPEKPIFSRANPASPTPTVQQAGQAGQAPKVHDPETNQEIVFL